MSAVNEIVLIVEGGRYTQATWWLIRDEWKCVGATHKLSKEIPGLSPKEALKWCHEHKMQAHLTERHNKSNPHPLPTGTP